MVQKTDAFGWIRTTAASTLPLSSAALVALTLPETINLPSRHVISKHLAWSNRGSSEYAPPTRQGLPIPSTGQLIPAEPLTGPAGCTCKWMSSQESLSLRLLSPRPRRSKNGEMTTIRVAPPSPSAKLANWSAIGVSRLCRKRTALVVVPVLAATHL